MKKSLSLKLSSIFSVIVLVTCVILVSTCGVIFKLTESTIKDIRYDDILDGYKNRSKITGAVRAYDCSILLRPV